MCQKIIAIRGNLKRHLTLPTTSGSARCSGLRKVIPEDVWNEMVEYYAKGKPIPDHEEFRKKY